MVGVTRATISVQAETGLWLGHACAAKLAAVYKIHVRKSGGICLSTGHFAFFVSDAIPHSVWHRRARSMVVIQCQTDLKPVEPSAACNACSPPSHPAAERTRMLSWKLRR
jgi:hypothetical protein